MYVTEYQEEIVRGERMVLFVAEYFVCWSDAPRLRVGSRNEQVVVPVGNSR